MGGHMKQFLNYLCILFAVLTVSVTHSYAQDGGDGGDGDGGVAGDSGDGNGGDGGAGDSGVAGDSGDDGGFSENGMDTSEGEGEVSETVTVTGSIEAAVNAALPVAASALDDFMYALNKYYAVQGYPNATPEDIAWQLNEVNLSAMTFTQATLAITFALANMTPEEQDHFLYDYSMQISNFPVDASSNGLYNGVSGVSNVLQQYDFHRVKIPVAPTPLYCTVKTIDRGHIAIPVGKSVTMYQSPNGISECVSQPRTCSLVNGVPQVTGTYSYKTCKARVPFCPVNSKLRCNLFL